VGAQRDPRWLHDPRRNRGIGISVGCPCHSVEFPQKHFLPWIIGGTVGVPGVQKAHASEFDVHVRWKPVGFSYVYWNNDMIKQLKGNWKFNLRDHAFTFPGI